jgi:RNA polymerase-binding transcription factor DksA
MATAKKAPAPKQVARPAASAKQAPTTAAVAKKPAPIPAKAAPATADAKPAAPAKKAAPVPPKAIDKPVAAAPDKPVVKKAATPTPPSPNLPATVKGEKDGVKFTKDFDAKFLLAQRTLLLEEREALTGQALRLEAEANSLIEEQEMGDVQFDDEGGEGDTMVVERERDLALSAQARQTIADIDAALERLTQGTYGYSLESGRPIARERLEAIPWATVLVEEKVGGIGRR